VPGMLRPQPIRLPAHPTSSSDNDLSQVSVARVVSIEPV
jgi:hypothetical protein